MLAVQPVLGHPHNRTRVSYGDFMSASPIYMSYNRPLVPSPCPFSKHIQKYRKAPPTPCLQAAFQIPLSLSWSKACGYNTLRDGRRDQSRAPSPRALARAPLLPQKVGPRGLSLPGEGNVGPGRGPPLGGVETGPAWPRVYEARTQSKVPEEEGESEVAGATAPVLSASVCPLNSPRASPPCSPPSLAREPQSSGTEGGPGPGGGGWVGWATEEGGGETGERPTLTATA